MHLPKYYFKAVTLKLLYEPAIIREIFYDT